MNISEILRHQMQRNHEFSPNNCWDCKCADEFISDSPYSMAVRTLNEAAEEIQKLPAGKYTATAKLIIELDGVTMDDFAVAK